MYSHERSLVKRLKDRPFTLLGINSDRNVERLKRVIVENNLNWRSWFDGGTSGPIASTWLIKSWPTIYILDKRGVIRFKDLHGRALEEAIVTLLKE